MIDASQSLHILLQQAYSLHQPNFIHIATFIRHCLWQNCIGFWPGIPSDGWTFSWLHVLVLFDYNRMSRVRQFGDLRSSRTSRNGSLGHFTQTAKFEKMPSTHSHYVCVDCVNRSMSQQKAQLRASQRRQENIFLNTLQKSRLEQDHKLAKIRAERVQSEKRKVMQHNKTAMKEWEERKAKQKNQKFEDKKLEQFNSTQYQKKIEEEKRREELLKENWRKDIDRQIQIKHDRIYKQKQEENKPIPQTKENQREKHIMKIQQEKLEKYRNDLLNQIKEQQIRKDREKGEKINEQNRSFILLDIAQERTRKIEELQHERKRKLLEQKNIHDAKLQEKRSEQRKLIQKQKTFERATKEMEQQRARQMKKRRESQIQNYLSQIKQQMEDKQKRRKNQQILQKITLNEFFIKERTLESRLCDSCEKPYPKSYLTKFQEK